MAVQNSTEKPTIKTESSRSFVKWYSMLIRHFLDYHNAFQYYKPHSIKFSMNGNWGLNWQKVTRELFPLKCRQVCAYFIYVALYISGICVIIQYIEPTETHTQKLPCPPSDCLDLLYSLLSPRITLCAHLALYRQASFSLAGLIDSDKHPLQ